MYVLPRLHVNANYQSDNKENPKTIRVICEKTIKSIKKSSLHDKKTKSEHIRRIGSAQMITTKLN